MINETALKYVGQKEKPNNAGFLDAEFEKKMRMAGFYTGAFWCAHFAIMCAMEAMPDIYKKYRSAFSANSQQMYRNFAKLKMVSDTPKVGAIMIFRNGTSTTTGHTAIVNKILDANTVETIEGNTSDGGSRNGDGIYIRKRSTAKSAKGLNPIGYIVLA